MRLQRLRNRELSEAETLAGMLMVWSGRGAAVHPLVIRLSLARRHQAGAQGEHQPQQGERAESQQR